jgi:hypothetical protein
MLSDTVPHDNDVLSKMLLSRAARISRFEQFADETIQVRIEGLRIHQWRGPDASAI